MTVPPISYVATAGGIGHLSTFWGLAGFVAIIVVGVFIVVRRRRR